MVAKVALSPLAKGINESQQNTKLTMELITPPISRVLADKSKHSHPLSSTKLTIPAILKIKAAADKCQIGYLRILLIYKRP